ncbi:hypothetical protein PQO03_03600 [Lentisphaera profundi]|uniref:Filamentation induced by cAMP protein Fic-like C-terminal domain-containing protein n=1 Tax=Lentisphaera profundi TaxID=1658616 RepID=A0ABY7VS57_9BACT|nr:hypothetical protein [Lentisphaera profundi]WDE97041.1 hypothetical protein PQO03_03600 [Lentisphaera profundi]
MILLKVCKGEMSRQELMKKLKLKGRDNFNRLYLKPALKNQYLERTIADKPNSRLQKYRLTHLGKSLISYNHLRRSCSKRGELV